MPTSIIKTGTESITQSNAPRVNVVSVLLLAAPTLFGVLLSVWLRNPVGVIVGLLLGFLVAQAPKVAKQWERAVVLRLGRYVGLRGPGLFDAKTTE